MAGYQKMDMAKWERKDHYRYYTEQLKVEFNMTADVDVTSLLDFCHTNHYKFYPAFIYAVTKVLNKIDNFRMFKDDSGSLCVWDRILPNYTIFHKDDHTFSDCWTDYSEDFEAFYHDIVSDMERYKHKKGIKVKDNQPPNFYCISCIPWVTFTGCNSSVAGREPAFFPIIAMGKYEKRADRIIMPLNITIAHAVCDGYHVGMFFQYLQEEIDLHAF